MRKLFPIVMFVVVTVVMVTGALQSQTKALIGYCQDMCCDYDHNCYSTACLCYCENDQLTNCTAYCGGFCAAELLCPWPWK